MMRERIPMNQFVFLMIATFNSTGHFLFVHIVLRETHQQAWMTILPSILIGFFIFYGVIRLAELHPGQSIVESIIQTFGSYLGRLIVLPYLIFLFTVLTGVTRAIGDFLPYIYPNTPYSVLTVIIVLIAVIAVRQGIEIIGRCGLFILPLLILIGVLATLFTLKDKHYEYLLPIFPIHFTHVLQGTLTLTGSFSEIIVAGMMLPNIRSLKHAKKTAVWFFVTISVMFIGPLTGPIAVFGPQIVPVMDYPTFDEIRYIQISDFLERLDFLGILLWTFGSFLKISVFLYALTLGLSQWCKIQNYRILVIPLSVIVLIDSARFASSVAEFWHYLEYIFPFFSLTVALTIPWMTVLVSKFRWKIKLENA